MTRYRLEVANRTSLPRKYDFDSCGTGAVRQLACELSCGGERTRSHNCFYVRLKDSLEVRPPLSRSEVVCSGSPVGRLGPAGDADVEVVDAGRPDLAAQPFLEELSNERVVALSRRPAVWPSAKQPKSLGLEHERLDLDRRQGSRDLCQLRRHDLED